MTRLSSCPKCRKQADNTIFNRFNYCMYCGVSFGDSAYQKNAGYSDEGVEPNLVIHFIASKHKYEMITRIVKTGQKDRFKSGDTFAYHLCSGEHTIVVKMAAKNTNYKIYIQPGKVVTIYASFFDKPTCYIDQPSVDYLT